jgi:hypothetical protein
MQAGSASWTHVTAVLYATSHHDAGMPCSAAGIYSNLVSAAYTAVLVVMVWRGQCLQNKLLAEIILTIQCVVKHLKPCHMVTGSSEAAVQERTT